MTITTLTIEQLCQQEEANNPDTHWKQERHDWLCQEMDAMSGLAELTVAYFEYDRIPEYDRPQLVCEAIKFLSLRLAGYRFKDAVEIMIGVPA